MITTNHPSYSPDLAPCDFFLFPKVKTIMRGEHFGDVENIKCETTRLLKNLTLQDMQKCFLQWKKHWAKCIQLGGGVIRLSYHALLDVIANQLSHSVAC
jgi:hypothetical protein